MVKEIRNIFVQTFLVHGKFLAEHRLRKRQPLGSMEHIFDNTAKDNLFKIIDYQLLICSK